MSRATHRVTFLILAGLTVCCSEAGAQVVRFESEWLFFSRGDDIDSTLIGGPGGLSSDDADFSAESGYRFTLGAGFGDWDIEASFMQAPWEETAGSTFATPLVFDDPTNAFIAPASYLAFDNGLTDAALSEMDEIEFLEPGATARFRYESTLDDFQLNIGSSRHQRPVWIAAGWRHLELDENSHLLVTGDFQTRDTDDGALPGGVGDGGNNALAGGAFTGAGFVVAGGPGDGFAGYDPTVMAPVITTVGALFQGVADNDLDGGQVVLGGRIQPRELVIIEGFLKAGLFHNRVEGTLTETVFGVENDADVFRRTFRDDDTVASFAGGFGFRVLVPLTDYIFVTTGYESLILTNVALSADQSEGLGTTLLGAQRYRVKTGGVFVAHGGHLGARVTW